MVPLLVPPPTIQQQAPATCDPLVTQPQKSAERADLSDRLGDTENENLTGQAPTGQTYYAEAEGEGD